MKNCSKCNQLKELTAFSRCKHVKSGLRSSCRACDSLRFKEYRSANPEKDQERHKKRYLVDRENQIARATQWRKKNPEKSRALKNAWNRANPDKRRKMQLKREYGISVEEYNRLCEKQGHRCAICSKHKTELVKGLCVDHCHDTGKVRGVLCSLCNAALGLLQDSHALVIKAGLYLGEHHG